MSPVCSSGAWAELHHPGVFPALDSVEYMTRNMFIGQYIELVLFAVPDYITSHTVSRQELVFGGRFGFDRDFEILRP